MKLLPFFIIKLTSTAIKSILLSLILVLSVSSCSESSNSKSGAPTKAPTGGESSIKDPDQKKLPVDSTAKTYFIENNEAATTAMIIAAGEMKPGDTLQFDCGYYELSAGLVLQTTENIEIKGCGIDETVLSFKDSSISEGIFAVNVTGLTISDLTVLDTPGDGIKLKGVNHGTLERVRTMWSSAGGRFSETPVNRFNYKTAMQVNCTAPPTAEGNPAPDYVPSRQTGRYGIYPVASRNIFVTESEAIGASDAGIYVGQTTLAIIKNSRAAYNVMGFEIENVQGGEYNNNLAECNTGGFLIYDLDGLDQYGYGARMYDNVARLNNTYNFNSGGFVGNVPAGVGLLTLSYDRIDIFDNVFRDNNTGGIIWASYELFPEGAGRPSETQIDFYTEGVNIFNNQFINNGNNLANPNYQRIVESEGSDIASVLPYVVGVKNALSLGAIDGLNPANFPTFANNPETLAGFRGGHIVWDGLLDDKSDCPYPTDIEGQPIPKATYTEGKPEYRNQHGNPECRYNAYKFNDSGERIIPQWKGCIATNDFSDDSINYVNFHGTDGLELLINQTFEPEKLANLMASRDISDFSCETLIPLLAPVELEVYDPSERVVEIITDEEKDQLCGQNTNTQVNFEAALKVDCDTLQDYQLFAAPNDPRSTPNSNGFPYTLQTKLFTDNAVKYRVIFLPPGSKADYRDSENHGVNATIHFPVGTIIAKTFAFPNTQTGEEILVETRLLFKRQNNDGSVFWTGQSYVWQDNIAVRSPAGATAAVNWHYQDKDSGVLLAGQTDAYEVPQKNQCTTCHGNDDVEPGMAPIGPKIRNINREYSNASPFLNDQQRIGQTNGNQIAYLCMNNLMTNCPSDFNFETPNAIFNKPGSGNSEDNNADIEARVRAYLESNCTHCHNTKGVASNTGVYFDIKRAIDINYGICKQPTAAGGEGSGGRDFDIIPGNADGSILSYRIGHEAFTPAAKMPPIARSVVHDEAVALINNWINNVVVTDNEQYGNSEACGQ